MSVFKPAKIESVGEKKENGETNTTLVKLIFNGITSNNMIKFKKDTYQVIICIHLPVAGILIILR